MCEKERTKKATFEKKFEISSLLVVGFFLFSSLESEKRENRVAHRLSSSSSAQKKKLFYIHFLHSRRDSLIAHARMLGAIEVQSVAQSHEKVKLIRRRSTFWGHLNTHIVCCGFSASSYMWQRLRLTRAHCRLVAPALVHSPLVRAEFQWQLGLFQWHVAGGIGVGTSLAVEVEYEIPHRGRLGRLRRRQNVQHFFFISSLAREFISWVNSDAANFHHWTLLFFSYYAFSSIAHIDRLHACVVKKNHG